MAKIKILHLELSDNVGGIESFLVNLYSSIDRERFQFDFITRVDRPANAAQIKGMGGKIFKVSPLWNPQQYMKDIKDILQNGYDAIHIHKNSAANILPFMVAANFENIKVIVHSHNTAPSIGCISKLLHKMNRNYLLRHSQYHFACSNVAGRWLYGNEKDFSVISNGILTHEYLYQEITRNKIRSQLGIPAGDFVIGHVGRFIEQKNHKKLVEIFKTIYEADNKCYLVMAGTGELEADIRMLVKTLALEQNVIFLGRRTDIADIMMAMDLFIMPSRYEGLPIAAIEAQASGLPLLLADTISRETKITDEVCWFSLDEDIKNIVGKALNMNHTTTESRRKSNSQVILAGYDMEGTSCFLSELYRA